MLPQTLLLALVSTLALAVPTAPSKDDTAAAVKSPAETLATVGFGIDPLKIAQSGGNENLTSVIYDPANAHSGSGYLSLSFPSTTNKTYVVMYYPVTLKHLYSYTAQFWAKAVGGKAADCYAFVGLADNNGNNQTKGLQMTDKYQKFEFSEVYMGGKGPGNALFTVSCTGQNGAVVYMDDVKVMRQPGA